MFLLLAAMAFAGTAQAQQVHHWVGGSGAWNDATHWSLTPGGVGGASVPSAKDAVQVGPFSSAVTVEVKGDQAARSLSVDGSGAQVALQGVGGRLVLKGDLVLKGNVDWNYTGTLEVAADKHSVVQLDTRGIPLGSDLRLVGGGAFNMANDLVLREGHGLELREGTLVLNGAMLKADAVRFPGNKDKKLMAGTSVVLLAQAPNAGEVRDAVDAGASQLLVSGVPTAWDPAHPPEAADARGVSTCGVGAGQTLFTINAALLSNYNGFGVSCHSACDGVVKVTVTGGVGPNFSYSWVGGPATAQWNNVCPGNQIVIVTDLGQGVSCATTVQVTDPARLSVIFAGTIVPTCFDVCNGTSIALAVGGVPNYTYNWNSGAGTSQVFTQLCAVANTLQVRDANNCVVDTVFSFPVLPIVPNLAKTNVQCNGDCNGAAQVNPTGGHAPFSYNWLPGNPAGDGTNAVTGLCAGNHAVVITDGNGCDTTVIFTIAQPPALVVNASHVDATCPGQCDGTATVAPVGGSGNYGYNWAPAPGGGGTSATATGLCAGTYTVTITDNVSGCDTAVAINITAPPAIVVVPTVTLPNCHGECNGSISLATTGGTGGFTYVWTPATAGTGASVTNLCTGTYSVVVSSGVCDTTLTFNLTEPAPLMASTSQTDVSCAGACDGTAGGTTTGGTAPYTYTWSPAPPVGQGTGTASQLCAGTWSLTIVDAHGCDTTVQYLIAEPLLLSLVPSQTDVTCGSLCNGSATVAVSGGTLNYTYVWSPVPPAGQGTPTASQLCAGNWSVTVTDGHGCQLVQNFTILPAVPINATVATTPVSCVGVCDGTATGTVIGGIAPYTYLWSPAPAGGQGTLNAIGLCAGPGTLTITDNAGCDTTIAFTIAAPLPIQVSSTSTDPNCFGVCDGSIVLVASGGSGTFTYAWTPASAGTGASAINLCAGSYQVVVSSGGCDTTISFLLGQPPPFNLVLNTAPAICANSCTGTATLTGDLTGLGFVWAPQPGAGQGTANATGLCADNYTLTVTNAAGCDTVFNFTIDAPTLLAPVLNVTNASCGIVCDGAASINISGGTPGYTYLWTPAPGSGQGTGSVGSLCPGSYTVTITDAAGCDTTLQFSISRPGGITATGVISPASCSNICDGTINVTATGGVAPYTWTWSPTPGSGQGTPSAGGLCPGTYSVIIGDLAGCDTTLTFVVGSPTPIDPHGTFTNESCAGPCDGTATVVPTGGSGSYTYAWTPASLGTSATVNGLCAGSYSVTVSDNAGCDTTWTFTVLPSTPIQAAVAIVDGFCYSECSGEGFVTASGGAGGYTYLWSPTPGAGQGTDHATGFCAGPGAVVVTDAGGCDTTLTFIIFKNLPVQPNLTVYPEFCGGPCTGEAGVSPVGGIGPYTYDWQPAPLVSGQGTSAVVGLCAGTAYTVTVTDSIGCDTTIAFTVAPFDPLLPVVTVVPATCSNVCDGSAFATATGGIAPYTYTWVPVPPNGQGTSVATGLCPGTYQVIIGDINGCDTTVSFTITAPAPIDPVATITPVACGGQCNGAIDLTPQGGNGSYTYTWTPPAPIGDGTANVSGLCAGDWTVVIADLAGCDTTITFTLVEPLPLAATNDVLPSHCGVCDGSVQLHPTGGTAPYSFTFGPPLNLSTTDSSFTGLCAGLYSVTVTDAAGCSVQIAIAITDADGEALTMNNGLTSCPGVCDGQVSVTYNCSVAPCTVAWSDLNGNPLGLPGDTLSNLCLGGYLAVVTNGNGCISIDTAFVTEPAPLVGNISSSPVSCIGACDGTATIGISGGAGPFTFTWSPAPGGTGQGAPHATGLCAGPYVIQVGDLGGCGAVFNVLITSPAPVTVAPDVSPVTCAGLCNGAIDLNAQGGTGALTYVWTPAPPMGQGTGSVSGLCPGSWSVLVYDGDNCDTTITFTLVDPAPLSLTGTATLSHCTVCDGTAAITATGGTGAFGFEWTIGGTIVGTDSALTGLCAGVYTATATDAQGCTAQQTLVVPDENAEQLTVSNGQTLCANTCEGEVSVSYNCSIPLCTTTWLDAFGGQLAQGQDSLAGLCVGTYFVVVANGDGCTAIGTALVTPSQQITPNLTTSPTSCNGTCDGIATVGPTGGTAPYTYLWDNGATTAQVTGLCAGTHDVLISDASGCDTVVNVLITAPQPITVAAQVVDVSCNGSCDGSIVLSPSGGSGSFTYVWSPAPPSGLGTNGAFNLCPGTWTVTVADTHGCDTTLSITIAEPPPIVIAGTATLSDCGLCNGTAGITISGGTAPYASAWLQGTAIVGTGTDITGLCAGLYNAVVQDANGCLAHRPVAIGDIGGEAINAANTRLTCPTDCNGQLNVVYNCSTAPCTVAWYSGNGTNLNQPGDTLSNLCFGTYFVEVTNGAGCITFDTAHVIPPPLIQANLTTTPELCAGACNGTALVAPTGGTGGDYQFLWTPPVSGQGSQLAVGLCAGPYTVTITDSVGCFINQGVNILSPQPLSATATVVGNNCKGAADGSITVVGQGGTGFLTYLWTPEPGGGQGTGTATGLTEGTWNITIGDVNGCDTTISFTLTDPPGVNVQVTHTDNACFNSCVATAHADISGGSAPYTTVWTGPGGGLVDQNTLDIFGLCAGDYVLTVTDSAGCSIDYQFTIANGAPLDAALVVQGESCNGPCDGTATASPSGGSGSGYGFFWQPDVNGQGTATATDLCPGDYTLTITDGLGCDSTFSFTIAPFIPLQSAATVQEVSCNGACDGSISLNVSGGTGTIIYTWTPEPPTGQGTADVTGLCAQEWTVTIADGVGCDTTLSFTVTEPQALVVVVDEVLPSSCTTATDGSISITVSGGTAGYGYAWTGPGGFVSSAEDLSAVMSGTYDLTVTDAHGCTATAQVVVNALSSVVANAGADQDVCANGSLTLDGSSSQGGTDYQWTELGGSIVGTTATVQLTGLSIGAHSYVLTVSDGICTSMDTVDVQILASPVADAGPDQEVYLQGSATLGGEPSGPPGSTYIWQPDSLLDHFDGSNPVATVNATTLFILTVTSPEGCTGVDSVLITVLPEIKVPSGFTPNGDGHNDTWILDFVTLFPGIEVQIFSRWGEPLFRSVGYATPWDGKVNGTVVPVGTYYYAIELNDPRFPDALTGPLTVIR